MFENGALRLATESASYRKTAGGGYPKRAAYRRDRRIRLRENDNGPRKPGACTGGNDKWRQTAQSTSVKIKAEGIQHIKLIDAAPIGVNVRSTVATYAGVHDELRKLYARERIAKERGFKASDFSYNTGSLRCPGCDGTGIVSLDVQFLPDVNIPCPDCRGSRYARDSIRHKTNKQGRAILLFT